MVTATGKKGAPIFVVGEAPGREELRQGRPFVGATGRIFWAVAREAGFDRSSCFVTNVVQSAPEGASGAPSRRQVLEEWDRLNEEMAASKATIMILVGGIALQRVTGLTNITNLRGYIIDPSECQLVKTKRQVQVGEYKTTNPKRGYRIGDPKFAMKQVAVPPTLPPQVKYIIPILHPAGIMRMQFKTIPALKADIMRAGRLLRGEAVIMSADEETEFPALTDRVAIDIETPTPPNDWIVERIGFADGQGALSSPYEGEVADKAKELIENPNATVIFHNSAFDIPRLGFPLKAKLFDTMYAAQLLCPDLPKGLERAATLHLDLRRWKHMSEGEPAKYNKMDARVTYELAGRQERILEATGQLPVFEAMMRGLPVLMGLARKGIKVDQARAKVWTNELEARLLNAHARWPRPDVSPHSFKQLQSYFYDELKLPRQWTRMQRATIDEAAIYNLLETPALSIEARLALETLREIRECSRNLSTYAKVEMGADGCVHPDYVAASKDEAAASYTAKGQGAGTGRIQARNPNIMNQNEEARKLYVPRNPGWCFAYLDWSSAEARVEAALSGDEVLMEAINEDLHATIQDALKIGRTQAKNIFYGTGRGAGPRKLSWTLQQAGFPTSEQECREMQDSLFRLFPKWASYRNLLVDYGNKRGYIQNPFGRRRYFYARNSFTAILGFMPQSTVADMLWAILPDVADVLTVPVHDAVLIEAPAEDIEWRVADIKATMAREWPMIAPEFSVPVTAKIGAPGQAWGEIA